MISVNLDRSFSEERKKYFPGNVDHVEKRVNIKMLGRMNFEYKSGKIDRNMKQNDLKKIRYSGFCFETSQLPQFQFRCNWYHAIASAVFVPLGNMSYQTEVPIMNSCKVILLSESKATLTLNTWCPVSCVLPYLYQVYKC